jgi:hypothetical protein
MKKLLFLIYFLISLFGLWAQQNAQELTLGTEVSGNLGAGDEYWYSVQAAETGRVIVYTSGRTDTYLEAYDSNDRHIGSDDDGGEGNNARLRISVEAGKTYLFKLRGYDSSKTGPYRIIANFEELPQTQVLKPGTEVSGNLYAGAEHWYSIQATEAGRVIVYTSGNTDTYLEAYDSNDNLIDKNDDGGEGSNALLRIPVEAGRAYLFKLRGYDNSKTGPYRIIAIFGELPQTQVLTLGTEVSGNLYAGTEYWYSIQAAKTGRITVYTTGDTDTYLEAYDSNNRQIDSNDDGGEESNALLRIPVEAGRTYLFKLRGYNRSETGPYKIIAIDGGQDEGSSRRVSKRDSDDEDNRRASIGISDFSAGFSYSNNPKIYGGHLEIGINLYGNIFFIQNRFLLRGGGFQDDDGLNNTVVTLSEKLVLGRNNFDLNFLDIYIYLEGGAGFFFNTQDGFSGNNLSYSFGFGGGLGLNIISFGGIYIEVGYLGQKMTSSFPLSGMAVQTGLRIFL